MRRTQARSTAWTRTVIFLFTAPSDSCAVLDDPAFFAGSIASFADPASFAESIASFADPAVNAASISALSGPAAVFAVFAAFAVPAVSKPSVPASDCRRFTTLSSRTARPARTAARPNRAMTTAWAEALEKVYSQKTQTQIQTARTKAVMMIIPVVPVPASVISETAVAVMKATRRA